MDARCQRTTRRSPVTHLHSLTRKDHFTPFKNATLPPFEAGALSQHGFATQQPRSAIPRPLWFLTVCIRRIMSNLIANTITRQFTPPLCFGHRRNRQYPTKDFIFRTLSARPSLARRALARCVVATVRGHTRNATYEFSNFRLEVAVSRIMCRK